MRTIKSSRRAALKLLLAGSVATLGAGCAALNSLPRGNTGGSTDGKELSNKVRDALRNNPSTAQLLLHISSEGDEVLIKGRVASDQDATNVEITANNVEGVRHAIIDIYELFD